MTTNTTPAFAAHRKADPFMTPAGFTDNVGAVIFDWTNTTHPVNGQRHGLVQATIIINDGDLDIGLDLWVDPYGGPASIPALGRQVKGITVTTASPDPLGDPLVVWADVHVDINGPGAVTAVMLMVSRLVDAHRQTGSLPVIPVGVQV